MQVERRVGEPRSDWRKRVRIAQNVEKWGLRVVCQRCGNRSRHKVNDDGALANRKCALATLAVMYKKIADPNAYTPVTICGGELRKERRRP